MAASRNMSDILGPSLSAGDWQRIWNQSLVQQIIMTPVKFDGCAAGGKTVDGVPIYEETMDN